MSILELALEIAIKNKDIEGLNLMVEELKKTGHNVDKLEQSVKELADLWTFLSAKEPKAGTYE